MTSTTHPDEVLARLRSLYPTLIDLSLNRLEALLERLGHPERALPPVIHVAGTNGKGSTCAVLRAIAEAAGLRVHVMTSPHLVSIAERFRVAGALVELDQLSDALGEVERINAAQPITVFEALTAAGLLLFARAQADLAIIEVGLGGRLDATNVVATTLVSAITSISRDHEGFLGSRLDQIAGEKAGVMRPGRPCVTGRQERTVLDVLRREATRIDAPLFAREHAWDLEEDAGGVRFHDEDGSLTLPRPALVGVHQLDNAGIAIAAVRRSGLMLPPSAYAAVASTSWAARMQRLSGRLAGQLPDGFELWLDGGHNEGGGLAIAGVLDKWADRPRYLVVGMKETKDAERFLGPLIPRATLLFLVEEDEQETPADLARLVMASHGSGSVGPDIEGALGQLAMRPPGRILICGSLHLAGIVLRKDNTIPL